ncbi:META domain-containing protein [Flavihumibacter fluvii]|uniref:META domain-containing protein n=1 Tax=Flavihumibacter fluvii TaxID=2838157 RepID=UPI001BDF1411|nr:META domain-containing protein [Flavihumibacter fluvii]ULQ51065.1 META domain-containing protein [Flavihumibacter fluvii]
MNDLLTIGCALAISVITMAGCASTKGVKPAAGGSEQLYMYKWSLIELDGQAVASDSKAHLLFSPGQVTRVSGNAGCNRLSGSVALAGESGLAFSPLAVTRMACPETTVEPQFLKALEKVNDWRIANKELYLYDGEKLLAKFRGDAQLP